MNRDGDASRRTWTAYATADHRRLSPRGALLFMLTAAALALAASVGVAWAAGFLRVAHRIGTADWRWLGLAVAGVIVSYVGYLFAYREVVEARGGPKLPPTRAAALVTAGFGVFIPRGGFALDADVWCDHGMPKADADRRVLGLAVLEWALLAPATLFAAAWLLIRHLHAQPGLLPSWVIGVPAGTVVTLALLALQRKIHWRARVWRRISSWLDAIRDTIRMLRQTPQGLLAVAGMALYWIGDITALGACVDAVDGRPSIAVLVVGYATGYSLTRRSLPLAGAGAVEALLPFALSWVSLPLASAVLAVFAYRLVNLWLPVGPAAAAFRHLRRTTPAMGT